MGLKFTEAPGVVFNSDHPDMMAYNGIVVQVGTSTLSLSCRMRVFYARTSSSVITHPNADCASTEKDSQTKCYPGSPPDR
eukprot:g67584.t1